MNDRDAKPRGLRRLPVTGEERLPVFRPKIDNETIFRELIKAELRNGRLSPWRRRKIVRYAAHLNMSAVEVGQWITQVRKELVAGGNPTHRQQALRFVDACDDQPRRKVNIVLVVALVLLVDLCVVVWLW